jgi:hypothetical protein
MFGTFDQPRTRRAVLEEISAFGVVDPLTLALRDSMPSVRSAAAAALDNILGWPIEIRSDLGSRKRMIAYVDTGFRFRGDGLGFYDAIEIGGFSIHWNAATASWGRATIRRLEPLNSTWRTPLLLRARSVSV